MRSYKDIGLILKVKPLNDADRLVTILGENNGKIVSIAKGANKPLSRKAGTLDLLNQAAFSFYRGKGDFDLLLEAELINDFASLKTDLKSISQLFYILELLDKFLYGHDVASNLYPELLLFLNLCATATINRNLLLVAFQLKLLEHFGFTPALEHCLVCSEPLRENELRISTKDNQAGYLCGKHFAAKNLKSMLVEDTVLKLQKFILRHSWPELGTINAPESLLEKIYEIQSDWLEQILEKRIKSREMLLRNKIEK